MGEKRNFAALDWVMSEISDTLKEARQSLEAYVEDPKDSMKIRFCLTHIHQVHGSLEMAEFHGAALLAEEMEHTAQAIMDKSISNVAEAQEVLMRGLLQLPIFLDHVRSAKEDNPARVMPLLNDLRAVRKQSYLSETKLFSPNLAALNHVGVNKHRVFEDKVKLLQLLKKLREMYQFAAASVLRGIKINENLNFLEKVFSRLELVSQGTKSFHLWEVADALIQGLKCGDIELSVGVKGLLRYLARELRIVGENAPAALQLSPRESLIKNLLFYIACAEDHNQKIAHIQEKYQLKKALLGSNNTAVQENMLNQPDPDAIRSVVVALQEDLANIKRIIDPALSGEGDSADLKQVLPGIKRIADTLAVLGIGDLRKQMLDQGDALERMSEQNDIDAAELMEVASKIIDIEHRLSAIAKSAGKSIDLNNVDERAVEIDNAKATVVQECVIGLSKAKEQITEYYSNKWDKQYLEGIDELLAEIRGGLNMILLNRAGAIVQSSGRFIQKYLLDATENPSGESLDDLADAFESIKYYLDLLLQDLPEEAESRLDIAEESVAKLGFASEALPSVPVRTLGEPPTFDTDLDALDESPSAAAESVPEPSSTIAESRPEPEQAAPAAENTAPQTGASAAESGDEEESDIDDEIIEIFIEEAGEVMETLNEYFPQWKAKESDQDALVIVRRAFHTLKGSGRMVEAFDIGELAWSIENMLNRVIDRTIRTTPHVFHIVDAVMALAPTLIHAFESRKPNPEKALTAQYEAWAHQIAEGSLPAELEYPLPLGGETRVASPAQSEALEADQQHADTAAEETMPAEGHFGAQDVQSEDGVSANDDDTGESLSDANDTEDSNALSAEMPQDDVADIAEPSITDDIAVSGVDDQPDVSMASLEGESSSTDEPTSDDVAPEAFTLEMEQTADDQEPEIEKTLPEIELGQDAAFGASAEPEVAEVVPIFDAGETEAAPVAQTLVDTEASLDEDDEEVDQVLREIFSQESISHLNTLESFIQQQHTEAPLYSVPTDALQRALHTLKGSAKMAQVWPIAEITEPLENLTKELITFQVKVDVDLLQLLQDAVDYTRAAVDQINEGVKVVIPKMEQYLARTQELRDIALGDLALPGSSDQDKQEDAIDPRMLSLVMAEEIALLVDADRILKQCRDEGQFVGEMEAVLRELLVLEEGARKANLPDMEQLSSTLRVAHQQAIEHQLLLDPRYFDAVGHGHNALLSMVDAVAAGQNVPPAPIDVLEQLEQLANLPLGEGQPEASFDISDEASPTIGIEAEALDAGDEHAAEEAQYIYTSPGEEESLTDLASGDVEPADEGEFASPAEEPIEFSAEEALSNITDEEPEAEIAFEFETADDGDQPIQFNADDEGLVEVAQEESEADVELEFEVADQDEPSLLEPSNDALADDGESLGFGELEFEAEDSGESIQFSVEDSPLEGTDLISLELEPEETEALTEMPLLDESALSANSEDDSEMLPLDADQHEGVAPPATIESSEELPVTFGLDEGSIAFEADDESPTSEISFEAGADDDSADLDMADLDIAGELHSSDGATLEDAEDKDSDDAIAFEAPVPSEEEEELALFSKEENFDLSDGLDLNVEFDGEVDDDADDAIDLTTVAEFAEPEPAITESPDIAASIDGKVGVIPGLIDKIDANDEDFDQDILEVFLEEADELVEGMDEAIHSWESNWSDAESLEELKRILHTIKGGARLSGLGNLGELFHDYESMLIDMGEDLSGVDQPFFARIHDYQDKILSAVRGVRKYLDDDYVVGLVGDAEPEESAPEEQEHTAEVVTHHEAEEEAQSADTEYLEISDGPSEEHVTALEDASDDADASNVVKFEPKPKETAPTEPSTLPDAGPGEFTMPQVASGGQAAASVAVKKSGPQEVVKVSAELLEELVNLAGETSINRSRLEQYVSDFSYSLDEVDSTLNRLQDQLRRLDQETEAQILFRQEQMEAHDEFDPLEMDRYSHLQQLSRSLTESASDLKDLKTDLGEKLKVTETLLVQQSRINTTLQEGLMRSRMVPFSRLIPRLRRIVRQVSSELGKNVSFELDNVEGELDRSVLERMVPPFEHMLRNAVDHGIESPEERINAGKAESGRIVLTLAREGGDVIIRLADDGRGVDLKRVREKAIERDMMSADADLSDFDVMQFILQAGFSTADTVTQISGRGVGMDVVNAEIKQLGGSVSINSAWGKGTEFVIRLPFTLSVNRALMVAIGKDHYAVPLSSIEGIVRVSPFELEHYYANPEAQFEYANENYHVRYLGSLVQRNLLPSLDGHVLPLPVLLVRSAEHTMALQVDAVMGSREIVVKSLGAQFSAVAGLSGATVMGDGSVVVILDPHALVRQEIARAAMQLEHGEAALTYAEEEEVDNRVKTIMVVDDSVTVRKVTSRFLEREGFEVITAKDGVDALRVLQDNIPDLMLLDIEMPRMDGFEVASTVRKTERWKDLPIIMITSRTGDKHREHAMSLGVNNYLGKPYQEDILLEAMSEILDAEVATH